MRQLKISKQITTRDNASLDKYLQDISKLSMITPDEEVELAQRIREGDEAALEKLVKSNLRFVVSVSKQYQNQGLSLSDLINEGNIGLIKAAKRFDEMRGFKFISYAVWWIRQSILNAIAENARLVRLPLNKVGISNKIFKAISELEQQHEREPLPHEIAGVLEISEEDVTNSLKISSKPLSVDAPFEQGEEGSLIDVLENSSEPRPDRSLIHESLREDLEEALSILNEQQRDVIKLFYGIGVTTSFSLEEIAEKCDISRERVRQIKIKALQILKMNSKTRALKAYL
ncbi:MAG: RNA polymerase subunit sigma [Bacteroidetes bacterium RIFCSPLOWO2_02_FULL_36_8]|nr:MAG: RNA polymerase subunit sigma [Bacteroidetes bacterium RIFCSPLOWO2_02_FULL_36_8]OFY71195.1 MAG: RNA polymerase subunit sigma [Bacteroidetes bacterium RIFCSPLOWO2_12_FULL_37_12]